MMIVISLCLCITGCRMTEEERDAYIEPHTYEYKVISAYQYMRPETNGRGGVFDYRSRYYFAYIDGNGNFQEVEDFEHMADGLQKVCIGNENKYVVQDSGADTYKWLYLTEETLKSWRRE